jgi:hypothetical protein
MMVIYRLAQLSWHHTMQDKKCAATVCRRMKEKWEMNIYKISQVVNNDYETYDSAIVVANNPEEAAKILPDGCVSPYKERYWVKPEFVIVEYIGIYDGKLPSGTVILASFLGV